MVAPTIAFLVTRAFAIPPGAARCPGAALGDISIGGVQSMGGLLTSSAPSIRLEALRAFGSMGGLPMRLHWRRGGWRHGAGVTPAVLSIR
jgi:hypothetical protein